MSVTMDPVLDVAAKVLLAWSNKENEVETSEEIKWLEEACEEDPQILDYELAEIGLTPEASKKLDAMLLAKLIKDGVTTKEQAEADLEEYGAIDAISERMLPAVDLIKMRNTLERAFDEFVKVGLDAHMDYATAMSLVTDEDYDELELHERVEGVVTNAANLNPVQGRWALNQGRAMFERWLAGEDMVMARTMEC
jgi:hypothetical protein